MSALMLASHRTFHVLIVAEHFPAHRRFGSRLVLPKRRPAPALGGRPRLSPVHVQFGARGPRRGMAYRLHRCYVYRRVSAKTEILSGGNDDHDRDDVGHDDDAGDVIGSGRRGLLLRFLWRSPDCVVGLHLGEIM